MNTFIPQGDKLEIINRKIVGKFQNRLNNRLLINVWIEEEVSREIYKDFKPNENTTYQSLWDTMKAGLGVKLISLIACIRKEEQSKIKKLILGN